MKHQRGVALLLVLWVLAMLSVMLSGLAGWVQLQSRQSAWNRQHAQAQLAAEAVGVFQADSPANFKHAGEKQNDPGHLHLHQLMGSSPD